MWEMYEKSLNLSQKILDLFSEKECDCKCYLTQAEICRKIGVSYSTINQHVQKMNWDEKRIINTHDKGYIIKKGKLDETGTYANIKNLLKSYEKDNEIMKIKDSDLSKMYKCSLKTVQSFKACVRCGGK